MNPEGGVVVWHSLQQKVGLRGVQARIAAAEFDTFVRRRIRETLVQLRTSLRFSQKHVAELMNTQQSAVSDFERGETDPRLSTIQRYARTIGCRIQIEVIEDALDDETLDAMVLARVGPWLHTEVLYDSPGRLSIEPAAASMNEVLQISPSRWESHNYHADRSHVLYPGSANVRD